MEVGGKGGWMSRGGVQWILACADQYYVTSEQAGSLFMWEEWPLAFGANLEVVSLFCQFSHLISEF